MQCGRGYSGSAEHFIGVEEEGWGNRQAQGLGGLEVNDQLELCRLFHGPAGLALLTTWLLMRAPRRPCTGPSARRPAHGDIPTQPCTRPVPCSKTTYASCS